MVRLGSPTIALAALTLGRPFKVLEHNGANEKALKLFLKNKTARVLACSWDNQYEPHVAGRIANLSSPVHTLQIDNTKDTVRLKKHAAKEENQEMSIAEYFKRYRLTIVQKFKTKQTHISTITEDFSDQKS